MDSAGNLLTSVDLGYPYLGQPYPQSGLAYTFPGNLLDYEFTATGSSGGNRVIATAQAPASSSTSSTAASAPALTGSAIDAVDISNGYPLSETVVSAVGVNFTSDAQLDSYAAGHLPSVTGTQLAPVIILGNGQQPELSVTQLGSYASVAFTSAMHPPKASGAPGFTGTGRVVSWTLTPPTAQQAEYSTTGQCRSRAPGHRENRVLVRPRAGRAPPLVGWQLLHGVRVPAVALALQIRRPRHH